jgi:hypothetical protein
MTDIKVDTNFLAEFFGHNLSKLNAGMYQIILFFISSVLFSVMYYVQSFKTGLTAKRWALAGLVFGPTIYPLFRTRQRIKLLRARRLGKSLFWA